jgi:hypothetical protein
MSNSRDLLKEAIADAKSVKEAAIANAKAALEEAFTPYLQEKFAAKLAEMEMEEEDDMYEEMTDENYGEDLEEKMSNPVMRRGLKGDDAEELETEKMRDKNMEEELDLEELLAELDEEMREKEDMEETLNEAEEEEMEMDSEEEEEGEEGDEEIDLEDMTEDELKDLIEDVIEDMVRAGELEAGEKFEEEDEDEEDIEFEEEDEEEMMQERAYYGKNKGDKPRKSTAKEKGELLKEEEDEMNEVVDPITIIIGTIAGLLGTAGGGAALMSALEKKAETSDKAKKVLNFLRGIGGGASGGMKEEEMGKMKKELEELASTLSEVKLLNAKLLYTNKIFRAKNLTESQKVKVLEAFDKAASVKDAKLIYETLSTVKETKPAINESVRGMASKAAGIAPEKKPILEVNDQFARWQVLAGIKK